MPLLHADGKSSKLILFRPFLASLRQALKDKQAAQPRALFYDDEVRCTLAVCVCVNVCVYLCECVCVCTLGHGLPCIFAYAGMHGPKHH